MLRKTLCVEALVAELAIEAFNEAVLDGLFRTNKTSFTWCQYAQAANVRPANPPPLSTVIDSGNGRMARTRSRASTTWRPVRLTPGSSSGHSRVCWSISVKTRNARPVSNRSVTKSIDQRSFARWAGKGIIRRLAACLRRGLRFTPRFSSR